jgi:hypothetical protein
MKIEINGLKNNNTNLNEDNKNMTNKISKLEEDFMNLNTE